MREKITQTKKRESLNKILYSGLGLILFGIFLFLISIYVISGDSSGVKIGLIIISSLLFLFGLILIFSWIKFIKRGIKYRDQLPNQDKPNLVGTDYGKYAGWSSV